MIYRIKIKPQQVTEMYVSEVTTDIFLHCFHLRLSPADDRQYQRRPALLSRLDSSQQSCPAEHDHSMSLVSAVCLSITGQFPIINQSGHVGKCSLGNWRIRMKWDFWYRPDALPGLWNSLPSHVTAAYSLSIFCSHLKSHLFSLSYRAFWLPSSVQRLISDLWFWTH